MGGQFRYPHSEYPHEFGYLIDCPACEDRCHCTVGNAECVYEGEHNGLAVDDLRALRHMPPGVDYYATIRRQQLEAQAASYTNMMGVFMPPTPSEILQADALRMSLETYTVEELEARGWIFVNSTDPTCIRCGHVESKHVSGTGVSYCTYVNYGTECVCLGWKP